MNKATNFSTLKEQERENRKVIIIKAAERAFAKKPFNQVTMRSIANEAGITPTAIYRYFADQQSLFAEAYIRSNNRLLEKCKRILDASSELDLQNIAMTAIDHFMNEDLNLKMRAHFMIDDSLSGDLLIKLTDNTKYFIDQIENHINRFTNKSDTRVLALTFFAALNGILLTYRKSPGKSHQDVIENMKRETGLVSQLFKDKILSDSK